MLCNTCKQKRCLKSGKPCRKVEKLLPKLNSGKISSGEISVNPQDMDKVAYGSDGLNRGTHTKPVRYGDDWELED